MSHGGVGLILSLLCVSIIGSGIALAKPNARPRVQMSCEIACDECRHTYRSPPTCAEAGRSSAEEQRCLRARRVACHCPDVLDDDTRCASTEIDDEEKPSGKGAAGQ